MEERICFHADALIDQIHSITSFQEIFSLKNTILMPKEKDYKIFFAYDKGEVLFKGTESEFISAPRLDDLECAFCSMKGFMAGDKKKHIAVHCVFDNEEVGSSTRQGAESA